MWTVTQHAWMREEASERHRFSTPVRLATTKEVRAFLFLYHILILFKGFQTRSGFGQSVEEDDTEGETNNNKDTNIQTGKKT